MRYKGYVPGEGKLPTNPPKASRPRNKTVCYAQKRTNPEPRIVREYLTTSPDYANIGGSNHWLYEGEVLTLVAPWEVHDDFLDRHPVSFERIPRG